jgi:transcriptional regulator with XRE-family HTH domain
VSDSQLQSARKQQALFSKRLIWALEVLGIPPSPTILQREYNSVRNQPAITIHAARKWLMGEAIPTQDRTQILAGWLHVSPSWLLFGEQQSENKTTDMTAQEWRLVKGFQRLTEKQKAGLLAIVLAIPAPRPKKSK